MLYYVIAWLGNTLLWEVFFCCTAIFIALYSWNFPFSVYLSNDWKKDFCAATPFHAFYLLVITLGFGGLYASIFVLPFYHVEPNSRYVNDRTGIMVSSCWGAIGALAFMVDPFTSIVFYGLVFLVWTHFFILP